MEQRWVPAFKSSVEEPRGSMERAAAVIRDENARLWLSHDLVRTASIPHAPPHLG